MTKIVLAIVLLVLCIPFYTKWTVRQGIYSNISKVTKHDVAIVLGAGVRNDGKPTYYLEQRLLYAVELYKAGKVNKLLLTGDNGRVGYDEISIMNNYLLSYGVPQGVIFGDYAGFDTYSSFERAAKVFNVKSAIVVSQGFHLARSLYIAKQKGIDCIGYAANNKSGFARYFVREHLATIKSFFDCKFNRKSKYYGEKVDMNGASNIVLGQL